MCYIFILGDYPPMTMWYEVGKGNLYFNWDYQDISIIIRILYSLPNYPSLKWFNLRMGHRLMYGIVLGIPERYNMSHPHTYL